MLAYSSYKLCVECVILDNSELRTDCPNLGHATPHSTYLFILQFLQVIEQLGSQGNVEVLAKPTDNLNRNRLDLQGVNLDLESDLDLATRGIGSKEPFRQVIEQL